MHKASHDGDATFYVEYETPASSSLQSFDCPRCYLKITGKSKLKDHKEKEHGQCYLCDSCGMRFFRAWDKKLHQQKQPVYNVLAIKAIHVD